jgi:hypothetical protein
MIESQNSMMSNSMNSTALSSQIGLIPFSIPDRASQDFASVLAMRFLTSLLRVLLAIPLLAFGLLMFPSGVVGFFMQPELYGERFPRISWAIMAGVGSVALTAGFLLVPKQFRTKYRREADGPATHKWKSLARKWGSNLRRLAGK